MEIDSHDDNYFDESNGDDLYDESQQPPIPKNTPIKTPKGGQDSSSTVETTLNSL